MFGIRGRVIVCKMAANTISRGIYIVIIYMTFNAINISMPVGHCKIGMGIAGGLPSGECGMTLGTGSRNL